MLSVARLLCIGSPVMSGDERAIQAPNLGIHPTDKYLNISFTILKHVKRPSLLHGCDTLRHSTHMLGCWDCI
jgi:hypothetical protein